MGYEEEYQELKRIERRNDRIAVVVLGLAVILCIFGAVMGQRKRDEFREACRAAGGVPYLPKYEWMCLRPDQVVRP